MTILRRSTSILFAVIGLLCVLFPRQITAALPCVLGGAMAIAGVVCAASCFARPSSWSSYCSRISSSAFWALRSLVVETGSFVATHFVFRLPSTFR